MTASIAQPATVTNTGHNPCPLWCAVSGEHVEGMHSVEKIVRVGDQYVRVVIFQDLTEDLDQGYLSLSLVDVDGAPVCEPETLGVHQTKHAALSAVLAGVVAS